MPRRSTAQQPAPIQPPQRNLDEVRAALEEFGCRFTDQRAAVYRCLEQADHHPTAEQVYQTVRRSLPRMSLATVYNALEALVKSKLVAKLTNGDASARYECRGEEHYHLRDVATDEVHDLPVQFDPDLLKKLNVSLIEDLAERGFKVTGYRLEVLGRFER